MWKKAAKHPGIRSRLTVSLHLSSPPCREVVCSLGTPSPPLPPSSLISVLPVTPTPWVPSICTGRWLDGSSYLHATPPPWQTTNLHRGCLHGGWVQTHWHRQSKSSNQGEDISHNCALHQVAGLWRTSRKALWGNLNDWESSDGYCDLICCLKWCHWQVCQLYLKYYNFKMKKGSGCGVRIKTLLPAPRLLTF